MVWILFAEDSAATSIKEWVKLAADYGASWVFTVVSLGIMLYMSVTIINLLKKWVPRWIQASIENQKRVAGAVEDLVEVVYCSHDNLHDMKNGLRIAAKAIRIFGKKAKEPWPSDALDRIQDAEREFEKSNSATRREREARDERGARSSEAAGSQTRPDI